MKQIYQVLKEIPSNERSLYNEKLISGLYLKFQENEIDDKDTIHALQKMMKDKKIVVIAPGKSVTDEREKIEEYMRQEDLFVISVNSIPEYIVPDIVFISNQKRYHQLKKEQGIKNLPFPVITTSNIQVSKAVQYIVNYSSLVMADEMITDNACLMLFNLLLNMGVERTDVIGFDGYHTNVERNYYSNRLINSSDREKLRTINKHIRKYMKKIKAHMEINYVTTSLYETKHNDQ